MRKAFITGVAGVALTDDERRWLDVARPAGLILFARNLESRDQIKQLIADFKAAVGSDRVLVLIDQEGGRVQRLRPPLASSLPAAASYGVHSAGNLEQAAATARLIARSLADELRQLDINCNCAPVLDLPVAGAHTVIGDRSFGHSADAVTILGRAFAEGLMSGGILPMMKHIPGHGRARVDSHLALPVVDATLVELERTDLVPFAALSGLPAAMTAHIVYSQIDATAPATTSTRVVRDIIRGACGFNGLLVSDDIGMQALSGSFAERTRAVVGAGVDIVLHCSGILSEMWDVADAAPSLEGGALERFDAALAVTRAQPEPYDAAAARLELDRLIARSA